MILITMGTALMMKTNVEDQVAKISVDEILSSLVPFLPFISVPELAFVKMMMMFQLSQKQSVSWQKPNRWGREEVIYAPKFWRSRKELQSWNLTSSPFSQKCVMASSSGIPVGAQPNVYRRLQYAELLVLDLGTPYRRENALLELSKRFVSRFSSAAVESFLYYCCPFTEEEMEKLPESILVFRVSQNQQED